MKPSFFKLTALLVLLFCLFLPAFGLAGPVNTASYVEGELLVRFIPGTAQSAISQLHSQTGAQVKKNFREVHGLQHIKLPKGLSVPAAINIYSKNKNVLYAEPNHIVHLAQVIPNDPLFSHLWGLYNTGQSGGTPGADIKAPHAWYYTTGSPDVIIAVLDTGVDYNHPDLAANMLPGRNFTSADPSDYMDRHGHGTHVAGTIAATGNNATGVAGVMWNAKILPVKILNDQGSGTLAGVIDGILYANASGAHVMNNSWGWYGEPYQSVRDALAASSAVIVCAAGNESNNNDSSTKLYPASFNLPNIISVAATDRKDNLATFSNFGAQSVHVAAPGVSITSAYPGSTYASMNGTSMAAPHVSGLAGLLKAALPALSSLEVKAAILDNVDVLPSLNNKTATSGRINAQKALEAALNVTPVHIPDPNLRQALRTALNKPSGDLTDWDLARLTSLIAPAASISDLTGLEYAVNLSVLDLSANNITSIFALKSLPLESLDIRLNALDLHPYSPALADIQHLVNKGTAVLFEPQDPPGELQAVSPSGNTAEALGAKLVFQWVTGTVNIKKRTSPAYLPPSGSRYTGIYYKVTLDGTFTGQVTVTLPYDPAGVGREENLRMYHHTGTAWEDITTAINKQDKTVTGTLNSFSEICITENEEPPAYYNYGTNTHLLWLLAALLALSGAILRKPAKKPA